MNGFYYAALGRLPLSAAVTIQFLGPLTLSAALSRRWRDGCWIGSRCSASSPWAWPTATAAGPEAADSTRSAWRSRWSRPRSGRCTSWRLAASAAVPGRSAVAVAMTVGAMVLLPFGAPGAWHVVGRPGPLLLALGVAMLASVVPYTLEFAAMRRAPRRVFGILLSLDPALATLAGWLLLRQHSSPVALAAVAVVITASVGSRSAPGAPAPTMR